MLTAAWTDVWMPKLKEIYSKTAKCLMLL